jgi:archaellum component FlaC
MTIMEQGIETLVKEVRKIGVFVERVDNNVKILAEGQEVIHKRIDRLDGRFSKLEVTVGRIDIRLEKVEETITRMDTRLVRVETNQKIEKGHYFTLESRVGVLEKGK